MDLIKEWMNWLPLSVFLVAWLLFMIANRGKATNKADEMMKELLRENEKNIRENEKNLYEMRETNKLLLEIVYLLKL